MTPYTRALLALLLAVFSIQFGATLAKQLFPMAGAHGTTTLRIFFASLILSFLFRPWTLRPQLRHLKFIILYGASLGFMNLTFYMALERIPLGIAVALEFAGPLSVAIFYSRKKVDFLWALLAAIGIFLILPISELAKPLDPWGVFYALLAGTFWAFYIIFGSRAGSGQHSGKVAALGMIIAAIVVAPFGLISNGDAIFDSSLLPLALGVAVLSSALPYSLEMYSLKNVPSQTFGILLSLEPAIATLAGFLVLNEKLNFVQGLAITFIIIASVGSSITSRRNSSTLEAA